MNTYPYNGFLLYGRLSLSGMISPTGQPTSQPSSQPTRQPYGVPTSIPSCQPSSIPSSQPSGIPTLQPTSQPTSIPSMIPSSQPSAQPFSFPTSTPSTSRPSFFPSFSDPNTPYEFIGGNFSEKIKTWGMWSERTNWNTHTVPSTNSTVHLNLNNNGKIYINENATVRDLYITGNGVLFLREGISIIVNNKLKMNNNCSIIGVNKKYFPLLLSSSYPVIKVLKKGEISNNNNNYNNDNNVFLESLILQNNGNLIINAGNLLLSNVTIVNSFQSEITFLTNPLEKNILRKNSAFYNFQSYPSSRLIQNNVLRNILPPSGSVFDLKINNGILVQNSGVSLKNFYGMEIMNDGPGINYYGNKLNITSYNETLYIKKLLNTNIDKCSIECLNVRNCLSFDFNSLKKECYLSSFYKETLGGLIPQSNQWAHYEMNNNYNTPLDSYLIIFGQMKVNNSVGFLDIHVSTHFGTNSKLISVSGANLNFNGKVSTSPKFEAKVCGGTLSFSNNEKKKILSPSHMEIYTDVEYNITNNNYNVNYSTIEGNNKNGLILVLDSYILAQACSINNIYTPSQTIIFNSGYHDIFGQINGNYSLTVKNSAITKFYQNSTQILQFHKITIQDSSILNIFPTNLTENKNVKKSSFSSINIDQLIVKNTGTLLISIIRCLMTAGEIKILQDGLITSEGAGKGK